MSLAQNIKVVEDSLAKLKPNNDVIFFVNGFWGKQKFSPANCPKECYWQFDSIFFKPSSSWNYNQHQCKAFFDESFAFFNTHKVYFIDGGHFMPTARAKKRVRKGKKWAKNNFNSVINTLQLSDSSKIHFVTHSMGGAYSEGIISFILKEKKYNVGKVIHLSTSEAKSIKTIKNEYGPELRLQLISQGDKTIEQVNRVHGYKRDNVGKMVQNCDEFACFYESEVTRPQAGDIGHALHLRKFTFDIIRDLQRLEIEEIGDTCQLKNTSNKVPYRKIKKNGVVLEYDERLKCFLKVK